MQITGQFFYYSGGWGNTFFKEAKKVWQEDENVTEARGGDGAPFISKGVHLWAICWTTPT